MDVREAARTAREYVADLFAYERIGEIFLEEVDFDDRSDVWKITVSFMRPSDREDSHKALPPTYQLLGATRVRRSYKVVNIDDESGSVRSVKHRALTDAD